MWIPEKTILQNGNYIIATLNHFVAVRLDEEGFSVNLTRKRHTWKPASVDLDLKAVTANDFLYRHEVVTVPPAQVALYISAASGKIYINPAMADRVFRLEDPFNR